MGTQRTRVTWFTSEKTTAPPVAVATPNFEAMTRNALSAMAKERGLNPWGTKAEIIGRLSDG